MKHPASLLPCRAGEHTNRLPGSAELHSLLRTLSGKTPCPSLPPSPPQSLKLDEDRKEKNDVHLWLCLDILLAGEGEGGRGGEASQCLDREQHTPRPVEIGRDGTTTRPAFGALGKTGWDRDPLGPPQRTGCHSMPSSRSHSGGMNVNPVSVISVRRGDQRSRHNENKETGC
jgi:hypothetical protein